MKRLILFSEPSEDILEKIKSKLFPDEFSNKIFAYMPSNGHADNDKYLPYWENYVEKNNAKFIYIDNTKRGVEAKKAIQNLLTANILMVTGGNTFILLDNLYQSGLFQAIKEFTKKRSFVFGGFSAGAIIMSPTIKISGALNYNNKTDENTVGITNLTGLSLIDFEVYPHYVESEQENFNKYEEHTKYRVKTIKNDEFIILDL